MQTAVLYWRISFNGGETQNFSIIINENGNEIQIYDTGISDEDNEQIKYTRIKISAGKYVFVVNGKNKYGNSNSKDSEVCHVKGMCIYIVEYIFVCWEFFNICI